MTAPSVRPPLLLSHFQAKTLLKARGQNQTKISLDLGLTESSVPLTEGGVTFAGAAALSWAELERLATDEEHCFELTADGLQKIYSYAETTRQTYSLLPTPNAPALVISGFTMHRIKGVTPLAAAKAMVDALGNIRGKLLDTATGLGYTAIYAAKSAQQVVTIEKDAVSTQMARANPWSRALFDNPKIELWFGDSTEKIAEIPDQEFQAVIHDPPSISLAGELYSGVFYAAVFRVLSVRGKMFHYIGDPDSALGSRTTKGVIRRLYAAGFRKVTAVPAAFGVLAEK